MSRPRAIFTICLVIFCLMLIVPAALAGISEPVIALHAKAHTTKGVTICSTWAPNDIDCTEFNTGARTGVPYDVYVVGVNPLVSYGYNSPTLAGVRWAIDYDGRAQSGVEVFSWISCGDLEFPMDGWPGAKRGNSLTWDPSENCQMNKPGDSGVQAVAGAFYIYAYTDDIFSVAPFYVPETDQNGNWVGWQDPTLQLANCWAELYLLNLDTDRGAVKFSAGGLETGFNPCTGYGELPAYGPPDPPIPPPPPPPPTGEHPAMMLLHVAPAGDRAGSCAAAPTDLDSVRTSAAYGEPGAEYDVFLLASPEVPHDPVGIGAIQAGIEYGASLEVLSWIFCGAGQLPTDDWPASGSGNKIVFDGCLSGEIEIAGYFRVSISDPALFKIVGHPQTGTAEWADCRGEQVFQDLAQAQVGWISLGGAAIGQDKDGCNPALESCAPGPVRAHLTTWGKLKTKY